MRSLQHKIFLFAAGLWLAFAAGAATTNTLVWQTATDRVSANLHAQPLLPLLADIAHLTGWHVFVEPGAVRNVSTKFKNLPSGEALHMLLGSLNFALVPRTGGPSFFYVFATTMQNATQPVAAGPQ